MTGLKRYKTVVVSACLLLPALLAAVKMYRGVAAYLAWGYVLVICLWPVLAAFYLTPWRCRISGRFWFSIGITLVCLLLLVDWVEPRQVWDTLKTANYWLCLLMLFPYMLSYVVRGYRWQYLLRPVKKIGFKNSFDALMIGFWGNSIYPARAGEFIRAYAISRTEGISKSAAFATVVMERIWDGMMVLFFLLVLLIVYPSHNPMVHWGGVLGLVIYGGTLIFMLFVHFGEKRIVAWLRRQERLCDEGLRNRLETIIVSFSRGIEAIRDPGQLLRVAGTTFLIWALTIVATYPVLLAFDFGVDFDHVLLLTSATMILVLTALAITLPSAPGGAGPFHVATMVALQAVLQTDGNLDLKRFQSVSGSFALVYWILSVAPTVIVGFYCIWSARLQLGEISKMQEGE